MKVHRRENQHGVIFGARLRDFGLESFNQRISPMFGGGCEFD